MHVSLDIETLSLRPNAHILSIGAVAWLDGAQPGVFESEFYAAMDKGRQHGTDIDPAVVAWWSTQGALPIGEHTRNTALYGLRQWLGGMTVHAVWTKGPDFDAAVLTDAYDRVGVPMPWSFRNNRCVRTAQSGLEAMGLTVDAPSGGHHALADAKAQAILVQTYQQALAGVRRANILGTLVQDDAGNWVSSSW